MEAGRNAIAIKQNNHEEHDEHEEKTEELYFFSSVLRVALRDYFARERRIAYFGLNSALRVEILPAGRKNFCSN